MLRAASHLKGMGIAYATSNRGACHLRAYTPASELGLVPFKTDPLEYGDWSSDVIGGPPAHGVVGTNL